MNKLLTNLQSLARLLLLATFWTLIDTAQDYADQQPVAMPVFPNIMQKGMLLPSLLTSQQDASDVKRNLLSLNSTFTYDPNWPTLPDNRRLGQVAAVCIDRQGNVAIFHRADRVWNADSFNIATNVFLHQDLDPIAENTILLFDRRSGKLLKEWGGKHFYLPHGLYIDDDNNAWTTDTALHQVLKFNLNKSYDEPELVLGKKFVPGKGRDALFCKPTSVAVMDNGDFFVADGYCNSRIVKFSKSGEIILQWGRNSFQGNAHPVAPPGFFAVPHALRLIKELNVLCVADRENGRVQCFTATNGTFHSQFHSSVIGSRLFSVDYATNVMGKLDLYVLNGPEVMVNDPSVYHEIKGFVLDMENEKILSKFGPNGESFSNPHDIAVMHDGSELYVAELDPAKVYRFVTSGVVKMMPRNVTQPGKPITSTDALNSPTTPEPGTTAVLVVAFVVLVAILFFGLALLISNRRKRGRTIVLDPDLEYSKLMSRSLCDDN